jgi:hypothetical protein
MGLKKQNGSEGYEPRKNLALEVRLEDEPSSMLGFFVLHMRQTEIRQFRIAARLSLEIVSRQLGRTRSWLSKIELQRIPASRSTLARIGKAIRRLDVGHVRLDLSDLRLPRRSPATKHARKSQAG